MGTRRSGGFRGLATRVLGFMGMGPRPRDVTSEDAVMPVGPEVAEGGPGFERRDADVSLITRALVAFAVVGFIGSALLWFGFNFMASFITPPAPTSPLETIQQAPPGPQLQVTPVGDQRAYIASENARLDQYGWVNQQQGVVRIPIEEAMKLTLQRGLPTRPNAAPPAPDGPGNIDEGRDLDSEGGAPPGSEATAESR